MLAAATAFCCMTLLLNSEKEWDGFTTFRAQAPCKSFAAKVLKQSPVLHAGFQAGCFDINSLGMQLNGASARKRASASDYHTLSSLWHTSL